MESNARVLTLLFLAVTVSGCLHSSGGETITEGPEAVTIQGVEATPSEIYSGQTVRASLTAFNSGNLPADVIVGDRGKRVLTNYCPDVFENVEDRYSAASSRESSTQDSYRLEPGEKINVRWMLRQKGDVPLYGKKCNLEFSVPFNYSVESYRQVQIKQDRDVSGSPNLDAESSTGPMVLAVEALPGTTGERSTYISTEDGDKRINLLVQLVNRDPEEEFRKGLVNVHKNTFYIEASEPLELNERFENGEWNPEGYSEPKCEMPGQELRMFQGKSATIRCDIPVPSDIDSPSVLSEITAGVDYTYIKDGGKRTVEVQPRG